MFTRLALPVTALLAAASASPLNIFCTRGDVAGPTCGPNDMKQLSCHNTTKVENLCCFNHPGGQILLTQFWNAKPDIGPEKSWTIHGLWPDYCDGNYPQFCDKARETTDVTALLTKFGRTATLDYMKTHFKSNDNDDDGFWQHEWNKHGTCMSTYESKCYGAAHQPLIEAADYFDKTVELFKRLNTYQFLADAGIVPSDSKTYTLEALQAAVKRAHGNKPAVFRCKSGKLTEVWYHFNVYGSAQSGVYVPSDVVGSPSNCPATGIKYIPKGNGGGEPNPTPTPNPTGTPGPTPTPPPAGEPFNGRGYLQTDKGGCLIGSGKWYASGTCATYTATPVTGGFKLTSSKGACGISSGEFACGTGVTAATFTASDGKLVNGSGSTWFAAAVAAGSQQVGVFQTNAGRSVTLGITWKAV